MPLLSRYLENPHACPLCQEAVEGGPINIEHSTATQLVGCTVCDAQWQDVYTLTGIRELQDGNERPVRTTPVPPHELLGQLFVMRFFVHMEEYGNYAHVTELLADIDATNRERDDTTCASHDYCDANVAMDQAFRILHGRPPYTNSNEDTEAMNAAWTWVKSIGFYLINEQLSNDS
jgi:hypothetical protein